MAQIPISPFLTLRDVLVAENVGISEAQVSASTSNLLTKKYRYCVALLDSTQFFECLFQYGIVMALMLKEDYPTIQALFHQFKPIGSMVDNFDVNLSKCVRHLKISRNTEKKATRIHQKAVKYYPLVRDMFRAFARQVLMDNKQEGVLQQFGLESSRLVDIDRVFEFKSERDFQNLFKFFPEMFSLDFAAFYYEHTTKSLSKYTYNYRSDSNLSCSVLMTEGRCFLLYAQPLYIESTSNYKKYGDYASIKLPRMRDLFQEEKYQPLNETLESMRPTRFESSSLNLLKISKDIEGIKEEIARLGSKFDREDQSNADKRRIKELEDQLEEQVEQMKQYKEDRDEMQECSSNRLKLCIELGVEVVKVLYQKAKPKELEKYFVRMAEFAEQEELAQFIKQTLIKGVSAMKRARSEVPQQSMSLDFESVQERDLEDLRRQAATEKRAEEQKQQKFARIFNSKMQESGSSSQYSLQQKKEKEESSEEEEKKDEFKANSDSLESIEAENKARTQTKVRSVKALADSLEETQLINKSEEKKSKRNKRLESSSEDSDSLEQAIKNEKKQKRNKRLESSEDDSLERKDSLDKPKKVRRIDSSSSDSLDNRI